MSEQTGANQTLVAALRDIAEREAGAVLANRRRLVGLLRDKLPEETRAIRMALTAYDAGVPARLRAHSTLGDVEVAQESHRLSNDTGLSESFARSAVEAWAQALFGYVPQDSVVEPESVPPASIPPMPAAQVQPGAGPASLQIPAEQQSSSSEIPIESEPASSEAPIEWEPASSEAQIAPEPVLPTAPVEPQPVPATQPDAAPLPDAPSLQSAQDAGGPPLPPAKPYREASAGAGPLPPVVLPIPAQDQRPRKSGKAFKIAAAAFVGVVIFAAAGFLTGVFAPHQATTVSDSQSNGPASGSKTPRQSAQTAPKRLTAADGTTLIGSGRYPTIQTQHEADNILTFKFATENGSDTSYAAAIHYQGTDGGTGAIVAVHDGHTASTGNVPLRRWISKGAQNVVISGRFEEKADSIPSVCVFATFSANTQVPEVAAGQSFCVYKVGPDGQCAISKPDYVGCANLK